uniref:RNA-directed RNA polymerase n=1 Tax=Caenorhabditis tropicalis TaxID=1561998 RepID=A0A1I7U010_9PELO
MALTSGQELICFLINSAVGVNATSRRQFETVFRDARPGEPDTLICICIRWLFVNGDFSDFYDQIKEFVKGKSLAGFSDGRLMICPDIIRIVVEHADNKSRKNRFAIKKDEFSICAGRAVLITIPYTADMKEPATILAEYTQLLFSKRHYDIEFAFEGNYGINRNMDLTQTHIKLLSKLTPSLFAEKGEPRRKRERVGRLQVRMTRITWTRSGIYYNAILELFKSLRATVVVQGEQPECSIKFTYKQVLEHTMAYPGRHLLDDNPEMQWTTFSHMKRRME